MGHGIAQVFASKGHEVALTDSNNGALDRAIRQIRTNMNLLAQRGMGEPGDVEPAIRNIRTTSSLEEAVSEARFILETIPEDLSLKQKLFRDIEGFCSPNAILATNTSVLSITEIASTAKNKERVIGTHFWNPPYLIPLVEIVGGKNTSQEVADYTYDLLRTAGKHPVRVKKDIPGFIGNRLQHALWREAVSIVNQGVADAETVDEVIKNSFGIRLPVLGPLETADMVGLDLTLQIHDYIFRYLDRTSEPSLILKQKVKDGELGFKTGIGFYTWNRERIEKCRMDLLEHLINWNRNHKEEDL